MIAPIVRFAALRHIQQRNYDEALWWTDTGRQLIADDYQIVLLKGRIARQQGDMPGVGDCLRLASELGAPPDELQRAKWLAMAQSGQMRQATPHLAELLTDQNGDNKEVCEAFIIGYIRTQQSQAAIRLLESWISDAPDDAMPFFYRARIRNLLTQPHEAEKDFKEAIRLAPNWPEPQLEYAELLISRKQYSEAEKIVRGLTSLDVFPVRSRMALADCMMATSRSKEAVELLKTACDKDPSSVEAFVSFGNALLEIGDYANAISPLKQALTLRPNDDEAHYLIAQAYSLNSQPEQAKPHFEFVKTAREERSKLDEINNELIANPLNPEALIQAGRIIITYGDPDEGVIRILAGLDLNPNHVQGVRLLADHYRERARNDEGFSALAQEYENRLKALTTSE